LDEEDVDVSYSDDDGENISLDDGEDDEDIGSEGEFEDELDDGPADPDDPHNNGFMTASEDSEGEVDLSKYA